MTLAEFRLPGPCVDLAEQLGTHFGIPSYPLLAVIIEAIDAVAGACLETDIWPEPVKGAFGLAIGMDDPERMRPAIAHILEPILQFEGHKTGAESSVGTNASRAFGLGTLVSSNSRPERGADLPADPAPSNVQALVLSNPKPEQLVRVAKELPAGVLLAYYLETAFVELVEEARSRATNALILLNSGWGGMADGPFTFGRFQPAIHAQVGSLVLCRPPALGRFLKSRKELVGRLAERFLFMTAESKSSERQAEPNSQFKATLQTWRDLVFRMGDACRSVGRPLLHMSPAASKRLQEFLREDMGADSSPPALIGAQYVAVRAGRRYRVKGWQGGLKARQFGFVLTASGADSRRARAIEARPISGGVGVSILPIAVGCGHIGREGFPHDGRRDVRGPGEHIGGGRWAHQ